MKRIFISLLIAPVLLTGCANKSTKDIPLEDAGQAFKTRYGTILSQRSVSIRSDSTQMVGGGAFAGGATGAVLGQTNGAALGGLVVGGLAGELLHDLIETDNGIEYVIGFGDGTTMIIDQIQRSYEPVFRIGTRVIVQFGAKSNRVLSAEDLPSTIDPPRELELKSPPKNQKRSGTSNQSVGSRAQIVQSNILQD